MEDPQPLLPHSAARFAHMAPEQLGALPMARATTSTDVLTLPRSPRPLPPHAAVLPPRVLCRSPELRRVAEAAERCSRLRAVS